jgi:hypothetical protein
MKQKEINHQANQAFYDGLDYVRHSIEDLIPLLHGFPEPDNREMLRCFLKCLDKISKVYKDDGCLATPAYPYNSLEFYDFFQDGVRHQLSTYYRQVKCYLEAKYNICLENDHHKFKFGANYRDHRELTTYIIEKMEEIENLLEQEIENPPQQKK